MSGERATYLDLKAWFLGNYYDACRDRGTRLGWSRRQVISDIHADFVSSFSHPIEVFFVHLIALVLTSGWDREEEHHYRHQAMQQMNVFRELKLDELILAEEKDELFRDLKVMGLMNDGSGLEAPASSD